MKVKIILTIAFALFFIAEYSTARYLLLDILGQKDSHYYKYDEQIRNSGGDGTKYEENEQGIS